MALTVPTYCVTPCTGSAVLRQAGSIERATAIGLQLFPAGVQSVAPVTLPQLASMAAAGVPLPVAVRQRLEVHRAVKREKAKGDARVEAVRERAREGARAKREEEAAQKAALKAQRKADREAERKRQAAAARRASKLTEKQQQAAAAVGFQPAQPAIVIDRNDTHLPWED